MSENVERKRFWAIFYSPLSLIVLLVVFGLIVHAAWKVYGNEKLSSQNRERVESELATVSSRAATLKSQVEVLQTSQGVDDAIRSKFNVTKSGEGVAVVVASTNTVGMASTTVQVKSWWQKLFGF